MSETATLISAADPALSTRRPIHLGMVLLLGSLTALVGLSIDMYLPAMPTIGRGLGTSVGDAQITLATCFAGLAIGQFLYGPASDRWGRRGPMLFGVALYVVASVACAYANSIPTLAVARFVQALGGSAGPVIARAVVRDRWGARDSGRVLSLLMLVQGLAPILAPFVGALLLAVASWRAIFFVLAGFGAVMLVATAITLRESRSAEAEAVARGEHPLRGYLSLLGQPALLGFMISGACNAAALFAYISAAPAVVMGYFGIPPAQFVWVFAANAGALIGMSQLNAHMLRRRTPERLLVLSRPFSLICAAAMAIDAATGLGGLWGVLVPLFGLFGTFGFVLPDTMAAALNQDPRRVGSVSALMGGVQFAMGAVVSALISAFHDNGPRPLCYVVLASIVASSVALYAVAGPKAKQAA